MEFLTRRDTLALGTGVIAALILKPVRAFAEAKDAQAVIDKFAGGKAITEGKVTLSMPEIAENGNTVPLSIAVESPMTVKEYVKRIIIVSEGNPRPEVATFHFSPKSGVAEASTRMRLAKTQNVVAVAEMSNGSFHMTKRQVKVTIGGCGG